jgi:hypothetical protein
MSAVDRGHDARELESRYRQALARFESEHGQVVDSYWCTSQASGVALTVRPARGFLRSLRKPTVCFHRATDWATAARSDLAAEMHDLDELAVKGVEVLRGKTQRICLGLVMKNAAHLLGLVESRSARRSPAATADAVAHLRSELVAARRYYATAANGDAQIVYAGGMLLGIAVIGGIGAILGSGVGIPHIDDGEFFGCLVAGAVGAVVSVMSRISSGRFTLHYDVGRGDLTFLGLIRPLLGAIFGLALYFAVVSGILDVFAINKDEGTKRLYFLLVVAFLAGFSERWAKDVLTSAERTIVPAAPQGQAARQEADPPD